MKKSFSILYWSPRILCMTAVLFISLFALDAFEPGLTIRQQLMDFIIHLIPSFILIAVLVVAWKWENIGGIIFLVIGVGMSPFVFAMNYSRTHSVGTSLAIILMITAPFTIVGILFLVSYFRIKRNVS